MQRWEATEKMTEESVEVGTTDTAVQMNAQMGLRLRGAREKANMSLREMARRVHLSPSFISQVELGRTAPSVGTLYAMVTELGLSLDSLMAEDVAPRDLESPPSVRSTVADRTDVAHAGDSGRKSSVVPLPEVGSLPGLQRADERPELYLGGVRWERLTPDDDPEVEFLRVTYPAGTESCPADNLMNHGGKEYIHILSGRLEIQVAFARQVLGPGDSLHFDSSIPHRLSNPHDETCIAMWFVVGRQK